MLFAMAEHLELPRPWRLMLTAGWNLAESLGLPVAGYFIGATLGGRDAGMLAATGVVWLTATGRKAFTRSVPGLLTISALVLTLHRGQARGRLGGAPLRGRERVRARVHDGDVVPERRERNGQPAGSAAHVHDVQGGPTGSRHPGGDDRAQHVPDQGGADAVTPEVHGHAILLPAVQRSAPAGGLAAEIRSTRRAPEPGRARRPRTEATISDDDRTLR